MIDFNLPRCHSQQCSLSFRRKTTFNLPEVFFAAIQKTNRTLHFPNVTSGKAETIDSVTNTVRHCDTNPQPLEHESSPITSSPSNYLSCNYFFTGSLNAAKSKFLNLLNYQPTHPPKTYLPTHLRPTHPSKTHLPTHFKHRVKSVQKCFLCNLPGCFDVLRYCIS